MDILPGQRGGRRNNAVHDPISQEYLDWVWEIPIRSDVVSVGYVTTGAATKAKREQGLSVEDIFRQQLMKFSRFGPLLRTGALGDLNVTSYGAECIPASPGRTGSSQARLLPWLTDHSERSDGRATSCCGGIPVDPALPEAWQLADPCSGYIRQPHSSDGKIF